MKTEIMFETIKSWAFRLIIDDQKNQINIQRGWLEFAQPINTDNAQITTIKNQLANDKDFIKITDNGLFFYTCPKVVLRNGLKALHHKDLSLAEA